jgi:hypothetical protein
MHLESLHELYAKRAPSLEAALAGCESAEAAAACVGGFIGALRESYVSGLHGAAERRRAGEILRACQSAAGLIAGMTQADVTVQLPQPLKRPQLRRTARFARRYAPAGMCAVLCAYLILRGEMIAAALAAAACALCLFAPGVRAPSQALPEARAVPRPDPRETLRRLERTITDAQSLLRAQDAAPDGAPLLTRSVLESIQMLCEASLTGDGAFALRAASPLVSALEEQGIAPVLYDRDSAAWFDLMPGAPAGRTIRPALVKDGRPLARGQAIGQ